MNDPLVTYLHDHLAGAMHAVDLLETIRKQHAGEPLSEFAATLLADIEADRDVLKALAERAGDGSSGLKEFTGWLSEKVTRLKMGGGPGNRLGTFEALEFLELGIHGKWALWRALGAIAAGDARLQGVDFDHLVARAETQRSRLEERRLEAARIALQPDGH